jgi:hypothetical protein
MSSINNSKKQIICPHNHRKYTCKECGGSSICEHKRIKYNCKECGGSSICEHKRIKYNCKECRSLINKKKFYVITNVLVNVE